MKIFISKHYLDSAFSLRKEYIQNLQKVVSKEKIIEEHKNNLYDIVNDMSRILEDMESEEQKREYIISNVVDLEKSIDNIQNEIKPYCDRIDNIRKEGDKLYNSIVEKYPDLTKDELKEQITEYIIKMENNS